MRCDAVRAEIFWWMAAIFRGSHDLGFCIGSRNALMAQVFDRSSNALARMSLVLTGLIVIALGVALDQLQRSPWVTRQGQRASQPVPFSHKHHVQGLGLQCQ